jgi:hypothetical protein
MAHDGDQATRERIDLAVQSMVVPASEFCSSATSRNASTEVAALITSCQVLTSSKRRIVGIQMTTTTAEIVKNNPLLTNLDAPSAKRSNG